ncbi:MAG: dGTP triphosphohydrolase [Acidiphilium sp.]
MTGQLYSQTDYGREAVDQGKNAPWRTPFGRDYGRVIHCASFRRLQGKTQVFPGYESDFFRNRLTHSLEVAQIAEGIAERINYMHPYFKQHNINGRLCATASLLHDIGHPPFGHNGERALDHCMRSHGGFEGNAQTLRIASRIEKKVQAETGELYGLNLTYRTLGSILKYDKKIPKLRKNNAELVKGYYATEAPLVKKIKEAVVPPKRIKTICKFRTIECSIMDIADDIAYSTYDLEDCLKAGFLTPASMLSSSDEILSDVAAKVSRELQREFRPREVLEVLIDIFENMSDDGNNDPLIAFVNRNRASYSLASDGRLRTQLSSQLVGEAIKAVEVKINEICPVLSTVTLMEAAHARIEVLKQYTYVTTIFSSRVSLPEYRGYEVVKGIDLPLLISSN